MKLSDFNFNLPEKLIAQAPSRPRDHSRLLVIQKKPFHLEHRRFFNIVDYLSAGDVLVLNNSKVIPARLQGRKVTGGVVEIFLVRRLSPTAKRLEQWECLVRGKGLLPGATIIISRLFVATLLVKQDQTWIVSFNIKGASFYSALEKYGQTPLPPYIKSHHKNYKKEYQTVYAADTQRGSVAAPTAGLHFTPRLLQQLQRKGVIIKTITLHVGLGTFLPIRINNFKKHQMHSEWVEVTQNVMQTIKQAKQKNKKVIAVGTTTTRALEAAYQAKQYRSFSDWVDIFIYPPYHFQVIDGLVTNFHLPQSSLLLLVSALVGRQKLLTIYQEAIREKYRFFSFGDAMLIV